MVNIGCFCAKIFSLLQEKLKTAFLAGFGMSKAVAFQQGEVVKKYGFDGGGLLKNN